MTEPSTAAPQIQQGTSTSTAGAATATVTVVETVEPDVQDHEVPILKLRLKKPKSGKKVLFTSETVDNEHMNKKKSKCCCVYTKPKSFDESSSESESDDECEHCKGHVEKKRKKPPQPAQDQAIEPTSEDKGKLANDSSSLDNVT